MDKFERKFGKYAIRNLSLILVICYAVGYLLSMNTYGASILNYLSLNPYYICKGQIWRLVTWIIIPPSSFSLLTLITLFFYYSIGRSLENTWGDFKYNVYIFSGMIFTILGSFIILFLAFVKPEWFAVYQYGLVFPYNLEYICRAYISTYYISMSIFLAFAATFPEARVLLFFIIPIKIKWLGYIYGGLLIFEFLVGDLATKVVILMSLLNFIIFFFMQRNRFRGTPKMRMKQAKRRREYQSEIKKEMDANGVSKHKCAICRKTELDSPDMDFRFCSKCNGNYEYCKDHLFTHTHVE